MERQINQMKQQDNQNNKDELWRLINYFLGDYEAMDDPFDNKLEQGLDRHPLNSIFRKLFSINAVNDDS